MENNFLRPALSGLVFLFCLAFSTSFFAQNTVSGFIRDGAGQPLAFANALVFSAKDSSLVKGAIAAENGRFEIENLPAGVFYVLYRMTGFQEKRAETVSLDGQKGSKILESVSLSESAAMLKEARITAKKSMFEQRTDRMVINVEASPTLAGSSALDVLERSPGVVVNRQSNAIGLAGKQGVVILLNGKVSYMPPEAVVQMLAGMGANTIDRIELLGTPPANLDAEGNAGFINIVLKRSLDDGLNGSVSLSAGYGGGGETGNAATNFNWRQQKFNLYGDYSYLRNAQENPMTFSRRVELGGKTIGTETRSDRFPTRNNHNVRLGFDYQISPKTVIGGLVSAYQTTWDMDAENRSTITVNGKLDTVISIKTHELNRWKHLGGNLNFQHDFAQKGRLNLDADYLFYTDDNPADYQNRWSDGAGQFLFEEKSRGSKITPIKIMVGKADFSQPIGSKWKLETGVKASISTFGNDILLENLVGQNWQTDPEFSAKYTLNEQILAAYSSLDFQWNKKTSVKMGLRYEFTDSNLGSENEPDIVDRQYGRLFPSLFLNRNFTESRGMSVSFSRRITRPGFNELAPFVLFVDPYTSFSGNSALQPAFSNNLKLDFREKSMLVSLQVSREDSTIARFQARVLPGTNRQLSYSENLKNSQTISLSIGRPIEVNGWWRMYFNATGAWNEASNYFGGELLTVGAPSLNVFGSQTFTLPKRTTFELSGFLNGGGLWGTFKSKSFGAVNAALQHKLPENGGSFTLGVDNFLNTMLFGGELDLPAEKQYFKSRLQFGWPTAKLSFSRKFGNGKMKSERKRAVGSEEERKRVN